MAPSQVAETADAGRRKVLGQWFTPPGLVDHVVDLALAGPWPRLQRSAHPIRVLDPACGDARFLAAVRSRLATTDRIVSSTGVDVDRRAVSAARRALPDARIVHSDSLLRRWGPQRFDLVIGNPPFLSQMAAATTRGGPSRFGGGAYAGSAAEFLALAVQLAEPDGGRVAFVLPTSLLSVRDVGPIREAVLERAALRHIWWSPTLMFDAAVRTCALVFELGASPTPVSRTFGKRFEPRPVVPPPSLAPSRGHSWGRLLLGTSDPSSTAASTASAASAASTASTASTAELDVPRLGDLATFGVDFRDQYYGLVAAVGEEADGVVGPPLITSGLIDPGECHWGRRPMTFAKRSFAAPRVDLTKLTPRLQRWAANRLVPKILIANQTRVIEAVADPTGSWLPSVPVITCVPRDLADTDRILEVLASDQAVRWVHEHAAGSGLSAATIRLTPALLASIPLDG